MDLEKLNKEMNNLPDREAILNIINEKTNNDMKEVISEIKNFESKLESLQSKLESKSESLQSKLESKLESQQSKSESLQSKLESKLESQQSKSEALQINSDSQLRMMRWVIGIVGGVLSIILTILAFKL